MTIDLSKKGVKPGIDNSPTINKILDGANDGDTILFPSGLIPLHTPILVNKPLKLIGDSTQIITALNTNALIVKNPSIKPARIEGIDFINYYGLADSNSDGIVITGITHMAYCWVKSFGGNGITVSADVTTTQSNSSFSRFDNVLISENKGHGIYFQGGDANQCNMFHCDARDNQGIGFYDHSFLGNQFFGCMAHYNGIAAKLSNYCADDANNRASFHGCYSEQGSAPEVLGGAATWHGGLPANGFTLSSWAKVYINQVNAVPTRTVINE